MAYIHLVGRVESLPEDERPFRAQFPGYVEFAPALPPTGEVYAARHSLVTVASPLIATAKHALLGGSPTLQVEAEQQLRQLGFSQGQVAYIFKKREFSAKFNVKLPFRARVRSTLRRGMPFSQGDILFYYTADDFLIGKVPISNEVLSHLDRNAGAFVRPIGMERTPWSAAAISKLEQNRPQRGWSLIELRLPSSLKLSLYENFEARFSAAALPADGRENHVFDSSPPNAESQATTDATPLDPAADPTWPYAMPRRGVALETVSVVSPKPDRRTISVDLFKHRGRRFQLPLAKPGDFWTSKPRGALTRSPLALSDASWTQMHISTSPAMVEAVNEYVEGAAQLQAREVSGTPVELVASVAGICRLTAMSAGTFIEANTIVGEIEAPESLLTLQTQYLAAEPGSEARRALASQLVDIGLTAAELCTLAKAAAPLVHIPVIAYGGGLVVEAVNGEPRLVGRGQVLLRLQPARQHVLVCRVSKNDLERLPHAVTLEVGSAETGWTQIGTRSYRSREQAALAPLTLPQFELTLPLGVPFERFGSRVVIGDYVQIRLSDPTTEREALVIPHDCVTQVGKSREVLVHTGMNQLQPHAIALGQDVAGMVEVAGGLASGAKLVRHLSELKAQEPLIAAAMLGFWSPSDRPH